MLYVNVRVHREGQGEEGLLSHDPVGRGWRNFPSVLPNAALALFINSTGQNRLFGYSCVNSPRFDSAAPAAGSLARVDGYKRRLSVCTQAFGLCVFIG